jgi:hypothetical protein
MKGELSEDVQCRSIENAVTRFESTFTNDVMSAHFDVEVILKELKDVKSMAARRELFTRLTSKLCLPQKNIWRHKDALWFQRMRIYLMEKVMLSAPDNNIMFKWQKYMELYKAMKSELLYYADVKPPDAYRDIWMAQAKKRLMQKIEEVGTNKNILIRRTVPMSRERRDVGEKWSYKKSIESQMEECEKRYFDSLVLMDDYRQLNTKERKQLMEMVREGLGRYPKWYQKELDEKLK